MARKKKSKMDDFVKEFKEIAEVFDADGDLIKDYEKFTEKRNAAAGKRIPRRGNQLRGGTRRPEQSADLPILRRAGRSTGRLRAAHGSLPADRGEGRKHRGGTGTE